MAHGNGQEGEQKRRAASNIFHLSFFGITNFNDKVIFQTESYFTNMI